MESSIRFGRREKKEKGRGMFCTPGEAACDMKDVTFILRRESAQQRTKNALKVVL
jgi:hypothetical protein